MLEIDWTGERFGLLHERAVYRPAQRALLIADPHFGKAATFRTAGIPVPTGTTDTTLHRLDAALRKTDAHRLFILGDFFHSRAARNDKLHAQLQQWRMKWMQLNIVLIRGNHDAHAGDPPVELDIECVDEPHRDSAIDLRHHPADATRNSTRPSLAGHVHPRITLRDAGGSLSGPCFYFGQREALLPAFGEFTGSHRISPEPGDRVFAIGPDAVLEVSALFGGRSQPSTT